MKGFVFFISLIVGAVFACTNLLVSPGASSEGSMIVYAADSQFLYGGLYHNERHTYPEGTMMNVSDWDTGVYLGEIKQANQTWNVVGNTNEWGLAIGETTFGGLEILQNQSSLNPKMDYGSLIFIALQRAKTAREAINVMTDLVAEYGYYSEGESFSIADPKEVWVLEMIGKGEFELGAVWVARRVPDGHVTAHANQARITTFRKDDPDNVMFSPDVISFAKDHGFYPKDGKDEDFSFSDVYAPLNFDLVTGCEMRVWSFFRRVIGAEELDKYQDYVSGRNYANRMPWSYPLPVGSARLTHRDMMNLINDHFENTPFEFASDVGAGPFHVPIRWRPLDFFLNGKHYGHRRSASTQQTAFVFVAQLRDDEELGPFKAMNWFGVDDSACTVFMPIYGAITKIPPSLVLGGEANIMHFSVDSTFWIFNLVSNMAYDRWDIIYPEIQKNQTYCQDNFDRVVSEKDADLKKLLKQGNRDQAIEEATEFSLSQAADLHAQWKDLWLRFVARFIDGLIKDAVPGEVMPEVRQPGYGDEWYRRIVNETGDKYLVREPESSNSNMNSRSVRSCKL